MLLLLRLLLDEVLLEFDWLFVEFARREDDGMRRSGMPIVLQVVGVDMFFFFLSISWCVRACVVVGVERAGWLADMIAGWLAD